MAKQVFKQTKDSPYAKKVEFIEKWEEEAGHESIGGYDRENDGLDDHPVSAGDASGQSPLDEESAEESKDKNIDDVKDAEEKSPETFDYNRGEDEKQKVTGKQWMKKKGPLTAITIGVVGGGFGLATLLSPALLLMQIKSIFTNDLHDSGPALQIRSKKVMAKRMGDDMKKTSDGKCGIKCRMSTSAKKQVDSLKNASLKPAVSDVDGDRKKVNSLTFPDGTKVDSGVSLDKHVASSVQAQSSMDKGFNAKSMQFISGKFNDVLRRMGISKGPGIKGTTQEEVKKDFDDKVDPNGESKQPGGGRYKALADKAKGLSKKLTSLEAVCQVYNTFRLITAGVKAIKLAAFARFAMVFLVEADKVLAGDAEPEITTFLGDQLTYTDPEETVDGKPNPKYGLSATDAEGYKIAAHGDRNKLSNYAQSYLVGDGKLMKFMNSSVKTAQDAVGFPFEKASGGKVSGKDAIRVGCKAMALLGCKNFDSGIPTFIGSIIDKVANAVANFASGLRKGGPAKAAIQAALCALGDAASPIVEALVGKVVDNIIEGASELDLSSNTKGVDAGNAIFVGAGALMGNMSSSSGLKISKTKEIEAYQAYVAPTKQRAVEVARYDARNTPFDIYSEYSFMGSIAKSLNLGSLANKSLPMVNGSQFVASVFPRSLASVTTNANASVTNYNQPVVPYDPERFNKCEDPSLKEMDVDADIFCNPRFTMSAGELEADPDEVVDRMIEKWEAIDEDGKVLNEDENKSTGEKAEDFIKKVESFLNPLSGLLDEIGLGAPSLFKTTRGNYEKYLEFCANRVDPYGETSVPIESDIAPDWATGEKCMTDSQEFSDYRTYTADCSVMQAMDGIPCAPEPADQCTVGTGGSATAPAAGAPGAPPEDYDQDTFRGGSFNKRTIFMLKEAEKRAGVTFRVTRGGYNSNFGHERGNGIDIGLAEEGYSKSKAESIIKALREVGFAAWGRGAMWKSNFAPHIHAVAIGDKDPAGTSGFANNQVKSYFNGQNGLGDGLGTGPDPHLEDIGRPVPEWAKAFGDGSAGSGSTGSANCPAAGSEADIEEGAWVWPMAGKGKGNISSGWGDNNSKGVHKAIDLPAPIGTPVLAAHNGQVKYVSNDIGGGCGGGMVISAAGTKYFQGYQHITPGKKVGDIVKAGDKVGEVGIFCGTGYHLHFSVEKNPELSYYSSPLGNSIDPLDVLP